MTGQFTCLPGIIAADEPIAKDERSVCHKMTTITAAGDGDGHGVPSQLMGIKHMSRRMVPVDGQVVPELVVIAISNSHLMLCTLRDTSVEGQNTEMIFSVPTLVYI